MTERPLVAVCLARQSALCNGITTFTVCSWRNLLRGYVTHGVDSTRQEAEGVAARAGASKFPPDLGAGLAVCSDRDPGWSPWPTPCIQTRTIASTAPRATNPAQPPTNPAHGWPSHLPSQHLQAMTAPTVLARSKPAFRMPSAGCARPLQTIAGHLARRPTDMESVWVILGIQPGAIGMVVPVNLVLAH